MPIPGELTDLLAPLMDGPFEPSPWSTFLDALRARTAADYASLIFRPPGALRNAVVHLYSGERSPPLVQQIYRERLYAHDPLPYHELHQNRPYALNELLRRDEVEHEMFYRELLVPSGMTALRIMRVVEASGVNAWLTLSRQQGDFGEPETVLMAALAPFLTTALRSFVALERERFKASVASEAIRRLNFGWLTLDRRGQVLDIDPQAERLLSFANVLRLRAGRLTAASPELGRTIAEAVKALASDPRSRPRAIVLSHDPWFDMLLVPTHRRSISAKPDPALIVYLHGDSWSSADRCEQLAELFVLQPREAHLALALSRGMSIAEAAADMGITIETARNYTKKIYAKTGARGQPDLIRIILTSVLAIA